MRGKISDMLKKNDILELEIQALNSDMQGIARHEGKVVFLPFSLPGEIIRAKIVKVLKSYAYAKPLEGELIINSESGGTYELTYADYPDNAGQLENTAVALEQNTERLHANVKVLKNLMQESSQELSQLSGRLLDLVEELKACEQKWKDPK